MPPFVRLFNWYISIIPYCLTKGEHFSQIGSPFFVFLTGFDGMWYNKSPEHTENGGRFDFQLPCI